MSRPRSYNLPQDERGITRTGARFAQRNKKTYATEQECMRDHKRLIKEEVAITSRQTRIDRLSRGTLLQTVVRIHVASTQTHRILRTLFFDLFRESSADEDGYEIVVTFNAILCNQVRIFFVYYFSNSVYKDVRIIHCFLLFLFFCQEGNSFSIFYGLDHREGTDGSAPELRYGETIIVRQLADVDHIPTRFDFDALAAAHRTAFENSNIRIHRFINLVYLIYRFRDAPPVTTKNRQPAKSEREKNVSHSSGRRSKRT
jgi:hypothetical protein